MTTKNKVRVPKIRFKEFSGEWKNKKLGDNVSIFDNKRVPIKRGNRVSGKFPYYGANGIQDRVSEYTHNGQFILIAEDETDSIDLTNYPIYLVNGKIWVNNHSHVVSCLNSIKNIYLSYYLKNINWSKYLVSSSGRYKLSLSSLKEINYRDTNIYEQSKIGEYFSKLDKLIKNQEQKVEQLKQLKRGYLQKMFPQKGALVPRLRFRGFSGEWEERKLTNFVKIKTGNKNVEDNVLNGKYNFFDRSSVLKHLDTYDYDGKVIVYPGEGSSFMPKYFNGKYSLHQRAYGITSFKKVDAKFIFFFLQTQNNLFLRFSVGTTVKSLRMDSFRHVYLKYGTNIEQVKIGEYFTKLDKLIKLQQQKLSKLQQLKKGYLQKMFC
ncbi:restriction endonuclease subunit S [Apilactobacillus ozensis]|uniref:restriction endonuclease subunit S n=1 Tax=Apilactobacillus ozensis TaxID=866801 RepID=UPI00200A520C|nr:restriction endonuclease subunit S [Apilactobacillus ozensis]MCK8607004.1 restriction endonuclease subunit S [Apilactobacillus ozensis]